jgi:acetyl esterase/lipase
VRLTRTVIIIAAMAGLHFSGSAVAQVNLCTRFANTAGTQPQPVKIEGASAHVYKSIDGVDLRLHVFSSAPAQPRARSAAVVFFFGGAWMIGDVSELVPPAEYLASRGASVILVDYRVFCRNGVNIVDEVADSKSAIRWIRSHADELGIDPRRIAVSGESSGGHLALSTAMFEELDAKNEDRTVSSKPNLVVLFYPCVDETTEEERSYGGDAIGARGKDVSPIYHIRRGLPPTLVFQGTADSLYGENRKYCDAVKSKGNRCDFVEYKDAPHGFFRKTVGDGKWYTESLLGMDHFLTQAGYLNAPAPLRLP